MGCKECLGRYGLIVSAIVFTIGVLISTTTPSWIETDVAIPGDTTTRMVIEYGPFYSRSSNCTVIDEDTGEEECMEWVTQGMESGDCHTFSENPETQDKLCRQHNTWRVLAMLCNFIAIGTGILVTLATCTQCLTCGCCGGSIDFIAMLIYATEVVLSIVAWSFAIAVVTTLKDVDIQTLAEEEAQNIVEAAQTQEIQNVTEGHFLWGFWIFFLSGTIVGSVCALFADWAADGSILRALTDCVACLFCCKKK